MAIYVLSPIFATLAALLGGWGVAYDPTAHVLTLDLPSAIGAAVAATGLSGAVFVRWGVR